MGFNPETINTKEPPKDNSTENINETELINEASQLIYDFDRYKAHAKGTGISHDMSHFETCERYTIKIEKIAKKLVENLGIDNLYDLSEKTGINFDKYIDPRYIFGPHKNNSSKPENQIKNDSRLPEIGYSGIWKTPRGYIDGTIISGKPGGPFIISTSKGNIKVDKIE